MRNFIIFFEGKEGTSPLVRLLDIFEQISIIHQVHNKAWEPFDSRTCGHISLSNLKRCLEIVFNTGGTDFEQLNQIYTRKGKRRLEAISSNGVVGFKMRFTPPTYMGAFSRWNRISRIVARYHTQAFRRMMINLLQIHKIVVFLAVRQDVLRWALSKYHGDGTGRPGHLQFRLARGKITRDEIGTIHVDCKRLEKIITECEESHAHKRRLMAEFKLAGIQTYALCYEEFLTDRQGFLSHIFGFLKLKIPKEEIDDALKSGEYFKKVHSDDISDFVENHEEVKGKFGDRFVSWC